MNSRRLMLAPLMTEHRTGKNYRAGRGDVRFGSLADIVASNFDVRFTPESGHVRCNYGCPVWANSGHSKSVYAL